jgi:molecular chaperone DnaK
MYQNTGAQGGPGAGAGAGAGSTGGSGESSKDDVIEAEVVDENK